MPAKSLKIDSIDLDLQNPRIAPATDQRDAMQKILKEQGVKIINLAESVAANGLSPIDRFLVLRSDKQGKFIVLEGNRRILAMKLLKSAPLVNDLVMSDAYRRRLLAAGHSFKPVNVEPLDCFEVAVRSEGVEWIIRRHTGQNAGRGIVDWSGLAAARFRGRDAGLQALDFVLQHGDLDDEMKEQIESKFPISTLERLLGTPTVRAAIGFDIKNNKLETELPADEALKPLKRLVIDLATDVINVTKVKSKTQQEDYVNKLKPADRPDLRRKTGAPTPIDSMTDKDFTPAPPAPAKKAKAPRVGPRNNVVPKTCKLNVNNAKISEIFGELRTLQLSKHPHAIAVLLRVFLETSVDQYLKGVGIPLIFQTANGDKDKSLRKKVEESIDDMVAKGAPKKEFIGVTKGLSDAHHPFSPDILHAYIHSGFYTPTERDLTAAWDNGQPLFERIWA